ncbi:MAG TPA: VWA domain-containing protein [Vicinamibacterales bacterium]|nr:VWA domain-containing protein [Vicinamibacterales bacterium]
MTRFAAGLLASACAVAALAAAPPQDPASQAYRGAANLVSVFATVTDETGRLVTDLRREEFEVRDNGRVQPLTVFSNDLQPFTAVVMLDFSGSMADHFEVVREGALAFVRALLPEDRVRIGTFSNQISIHPDTFTGDRDVLTSVLTGPPPELGPSPVWGAIDRSITALLPAEGRRVVLIFSDGHNNPRRGQSLSTPDDLIRRARYNDIMIYSIGFWDEGFTSGGAPVIFPPQTSIVIRFPGGTVGKPSRPPSRKGSSSGKGEPPDPALRELADETAGGYFELGRRDNLGATFARVAEELHRQYWLGFAPAKLDGKTHRLEVKVKRPGVKVRSRASYVAK